MPTPTLRWGPPPQPPSPPAVLSPRSGRWVSPGTGSPIPPPPPPPPPPPLPPALRQPCAGHWSTISPSVERRRSSLAARLSASADSPPLPCDESVLRRRREEHAEGLAAAARGLSDVRRAELELAAAAARCEREQTQLQLEEQQHRQDQQLRAVDGALSAIREEAAEHVSECLGLRLQLQRQSAEQEAAVGALRLQLQRQSAEHEQLQRAAADQLRLMDAELVQLRQHATDAAARSGRADAECDELRSELAAAEEACADGAERLQAAALRDRRRDEELSRLCRALAAEKRERERQEHQILDLAESQQAAAGAERALREEHALMMRDVAARHAAALDDHSRRHASQLGAEAAARAQVHADSVAMRDGLDRAAEHHHRLELEVARLRRALLEWEDWAACRGERPRDSGRDGGGGSDALQRSLDDMRREREQLRDELEAARRARTDAGRERDEARQELDAAKRARTDALRDAEDAKAALEGSRDAARRLEQEAADARADAARLRREQLRTDAATSPRHLPPRLRMKVWPVILQRSPTPKPASPRRDEQLGQELAALREQVAGLSQQPDTLVCRERSPRFAASRVDPREVDRLRSDNDALRQELRQSEATRAALGTELARVKERLRLQAEQADAMQVALADSAARDHAARVRDMDAAAMAERLAAVCRDADGFRAAADAALAAQAAAEDRAAAEATARDAAAAAADAHCRRAQELDAELAHTRGRMAAAVRAVEQADGRATAAEAAATHAASALAVVRGRPMAFAAEPQASPARLPAPR
eukprot:TRINITY_DN3879_c0_g1_i1.p1 TRINITY_DN3879_c0_g1~~TRINITY_DN3879_c0_g1_i1.p1  ORF type:complete len:789 (+),score=343.06 TRINITY_DN3879_c0_g1_i1:43-2367(+)